MNYQINDDNDDNERVVHRPHGTIDTYLKEKVLTHFDYRCCFLKKINCSIYDRV